MIRRRSRALLRSGGAEMRRAMPMASIAKPQRRVTTVSALLPSSKATRAQITEIA